MVIFSAVSLRSQREASHGARQASLLSMGGGVCEREAAKMAFDRLLHLLRST